MKTINRHAVFAIILLTVAVVTYGCAVNLVGNGTVLLEIAPSKDIHISKVYIFQDGNEMVISGEVKRSVINQGYVDITVLAPDGTIIKQVSVSDRPVSLRKMMNGESSFTIRLPLVPSHGAKVLVAYQRQT